MASSHLLIVSDIHIGEYVKEVDRIGYIKGFNRRDEALCAFLEFHQKRWIDGVPWRLVINGDFIDFVAVTMLPGEQQQDLRPELRLTDEENVWGLDSSEGKAVWKLARIVERHRMLFAYLADFVGHGNSLEILHGNHDSEFWWSGVHDAFREHLRRIYFGGEAVGGVDLEDFLGRIRFHPWFLYEPGRFYIEHGNQYDDFSSFEYRLNPVAPYDDAQLAMPVSHMAIRYFVNQYKGFRSHNKDNWTILEYLRWLHQQGMDNTMRIGKLYLSLSARVLSYAQATRASEEGRLAEQHHQTLLDVARRYGMSADEAERLDALRNEPVTESLGRTMQTVGIDKQLLGGFWALVIFTVLAIPFSWAITAVLLALALALCWASFKSWPWVRQHYLGGNITTSVAPKVDDAAAQIAAILGVRYVIFGHTHNPLKTRVRNNPPCWYINSGSWLAPRQRERHTDGHCPSRLTFIVFRDGAVPDARLFRWCARDNQPVPFDPRVGLQSLDPERVEHANTHKPARLRSRRAGLRRPPTKP